MKKRLRKKAAGRSEKMCRDKIHELLDIVLDINGLKARKKSETGTLPTVFFEFSGHVGTIYVSVYENGWERDSEKDMGADIRSWKFKELCNAVDRLDAEKEKLAHAGD